MSDAKVLKSKGSKEPFARFLENPTREGLRELLQNHLGETKNLDFKTLWESWAKMAKHILGLANAEGGCIIVGVSQKADNSFDPVGLDKIVDKADIVNGIQKYLPNKLAYDVLDFAFEESEYPKIKGKKFQLLIIEDSPESIPFVSMAGGDGIRQNAIYVRRQGETLEADYNELQEVINRRIETQYSSKSENALLTNLGQLKALYQFIPKKLNIFDRMTANMGILIDNPEYPSESCEDFIKSLIEVKKKMITDQIGKT